jgi:exodeoxyribonuclease-1
MLGPEKLAARAKLIKDNKKFAEKISLILQDEAEEKEQTKSQEDIYEEESIYTKFTSPEDNKIMPEFHKAEWEKKLSVLDKLKDERLHYFGRRLIYEEKPEILPKAEYNQIHRTIAKRLLSTNNEKWNTIPRTYSEIDTLREKFEREGQSERLAILDDINAYVEEMEKFYNAV